MSSGTHKILAIHVLLLALAISAAAQTTDDFFNDNLVQEIRLEVRPSDWANLKLHYLDNTYYPADFHWKFQGRDIVVKDIGIRSRGRGSRSPLKPNLRLDFNRYEVGQKFLGLGSAVLKANNQDASALKERIVFKLFKSMGLPASRQAHTRFYINNDYSGLYLLTEEIRKEYVQRYIGGVEGDGDLYKWNPIDNEEGGYHFTWRPTCARASMLACSTDSTRWTPNPFDPEENKSSFDIRPTIDFVRKMTETSDADFAQTIAQYTDLKLFLAHVALENYVADYDAILGDTFGLNNFFVYRYDNKNFHQFLVWDKDGSFDYFGREFFQNADKDVLMRRTLALPGRRNQYLEMINKVAVLAGGPGGWMEWENQREFNQIKNALYEDPLKLYSEGGVVKSSSNERVDAQVAANGQFARDRQGFVLPGLTAAGYQPAGGPSLSPGGAVNAATNTAGALAAGSLVSLYGSGLTGATAQATTLPLPTTMGGVSVFINGFPAPLLFVSPNQINLQVPWELGLGNGTAPFTVMVSGPPVQGTATGSPFNATISNSITANVGPVSPGMFAVVQADGSLTTAKPAGAGDVLVLYANGLGPVDNPVVTGQAAGSSPLALTTFFPSVAIGGVPAKVLFSGLAPGFVGLYQVNIEVPAGVQAGGSTPLVLTVSGQTASVTIATR